jgi:hypothetical protein
LILSCGTAHAATTIRLALAEKAFTLVRARPLRGTVEIEVRPNPGITPKGLRGLSPAVQGASIYALPRNGVRMMLSFRDLVWVKVSRRTRELALSLEPLPGRAPLESGAAIYPRRSPTETPRAPKGACTAVSRALAEVRAGQLGDPARRLIELVARGGSCGAEARLAVAEAALRLDRPSFAVEMAALAPRSPSRDRLLAHAAFLAGDYERASAAFRRIGRARAPLELAADAHIGAGELGRARRWLEAARTATPARAAEISMRLGDVALLAGETRTPPSAGSSSEDAAWQRLQGAYASRQLDLARADALSLSRAAHPGPRSTAARDLARRLLTEMVRAGGRDPAALALRYFEDPVAFEDEAEGDELCGAASRALGELGLTWALERAVRRCLPLHRAAGQERVALLRLAAARRERGDIEGDLRTLRYLAARDPLGAAHDGGFWLAFGEALARTGAFTEAVQVLRRAMTAGSARERQEARSALADVFLRTGHLDAWRLLAGKAAAAPTPGDDNGSEIRGHERAVAEGIRALGRTEAGEP